MHSLDDAGQEDRGAKLSSLCISLHFGKRPSAIISRTITLLPYHGIDGYATPLAESFFAAHLTTTAGSNGNRQRP